MQTVSRTTFTTVKTEGAILPADLLGRVAEGRGLDGLRPEDYHLLPTERLNEAVNRSWNRCLSAWASFDHARRNLPESDAGTTLTRERWLLVLFQELGYGRLRFAGNLPLEADDPQSPTYPISHRWGQAPIHLVTFRQDLDRRSENGGPSSAVRRRSRSPHSLLQEFLNRSDDHLWGFLSNGLRLRVLRDNVSLTRAAYVEFDLEAMMRGELYADYSLLWLVCHQSRVEGEPPAECWLERWSQVAAEQGVRAMDALRDGVQEAIAVLGRGFLAHRANGELKTRLQSGALSAQDYYRQLLRLVYRLIFLFVAEDRDLLLLPGEGDGRPPTADRGQPSAVGDPSSAYARFYSAGRLRSLAETLRGGPHADLYRGLCQIFTLLRDGYPPLGLPALGSFLISERATPDLDRADLANSALLETIRALAFTIEDKVRRPVDYRNLGAEELGSVYESLLELHPQINADAATFALDVAAGSERKTTGSYYTPSSLIRCLLDTALEPVVDDRLASVKRKDVKRNKGGGEGHDHVLRFTDYESALLDIKVVDPACGSGHFLIAAAHHLARHLARARTGDEEPAPAELRAALRDVVRHCIHGVDLNPMAVELCKVALWMETLDPGKPLSFLDKNIRCGNSLIGVGPGMEIDEIPDDAFKPVTGDHKQTATALRRRNKRERGDRERDAGGQMGFRWDVTVFESQADLARWREAQLAQLEVMPEDEAHQLREKETAYATYLESEQYVYGRLEYDLWTAAFFWPIPQGDAETMLAPTQQELDMLRDGQTPDAELVRRVRELAESHGFFHWELEFPTVFSGDEPGFDVVLGNPPWEKLQTEELQFFAVRDPAIAALKGAKRKKAIADIHKTNPTLATAWEGQRREDAATISFIRNSNAFPLTGIGKFNTFALFAELGQRLVAPNGCVGCVLPSGIATDNTTRYFFRNLMDSQLLVSLYDFENRAKLFPAVDSRIKFCLLTLTGQDHPTQAGAQFSFFAHRVEDLNDPERHFSLSADEIALLNPNTRTCPIFRYRRDAELTKAVFRRVPVFLDERNPSNNKYDPKVWRLINTTDDSSQFVELPSSPEGSELIPVIEAKTIHQFDHRFATFQQDEGSSTRVTEVHGKQKTNPGFETHARHYITDSYFRQRLPNELEGKQWFLTFRNIARVTDERTVISTIIPRAAGCEHTPYIEIAGDGQSSAFLVGMLNSFALDYIARQKVGGTTLSYFYLYQFPILPVSMIQVPPLEFFVHKVLELVYTSYSLEGFGRDCGYDGPPFRWDEERRFLLRCELDAAYFHLYGIARDDVDYIMETFPIVKRKDEASHGEYRTKRVILEIYDAMQHAIETGRPYQTLLDPPPADPRVAHPPRRKES